MNNDRTSKQLGIFYTPDKLAHIIAKNIVTRTNQTILDPSFGHCSLLQAAGEQLLASNNHTPETNLYGVDIDPASLEHILQNESISFRRGNFVIGNFLSVSPSDLKDAPFDIILGNPPYTRHHEIPHSEKAIAKKNMESIDVDVSGLSGYWTFFLIHSLQFLKRGGALSMLLPYAMLGADYSKSIQKIIQYSFRTSTVHILKSEYFTEALEHVILLDARDFLGINKGPKGVVYTILNGLDGNTSAPAPKTKGWETTPLFLDSEIRKILSEMKTHSETKKLDEIAKIRIGVVTGANNYFILNCTEITEMQLGEEVLQPIITQSNMLRGLYVGKSDFRQLSDDGKSVYLIKTESLDSIPHKLDEYLNNKDGIIVKQGFHCRHRKPWHSVIVGAKPDAFTHYMATVTPRIILNKTDATCTNTIHRLYWKKNISSKQKRVAALASLTSLSNLSTEIHGRSLAGGLLKIEPSRCALTLLPIPEITIDSSDWKLVHSILQKGLLQNAIDLADNIILKDGLDMKVRKIKSLQEGFKKLLKYRKYKI